MVPDSPVRCPSSTLRKRTWSYTNIAYQKLGLRAIGRYRRRSAEGRAGEEQEHEGEETEAVKSQRLALALCGYVWHSTTVFR